MTEVTRETRRESYIAKPSQRKTAILAALGDDKLTAREIAQRMNYSDMNMVRPRLTELLDEGIIETLGSVKDDVTGRSVAVFARCV